MKLWSLLKEKMLSFSSQRISDESHESTYREFLREAESFSEQLACEPCCAVLCDSEWLAAQAILSCFAAGVTAVPLSWRYGEKHCRKILDFIQPTAIITDTDGALHVVRLSDNAWATDDSPAFIMCTSGTTGTPKGVMLSEKNIITNLKDIAAYFDLHENDTILIARPLYHCAVLTGEFLVSLMKGVRIRFHSEPFNPKNVWKTIITNTVTVFGGTPTVFSMLIRCAKRPVDSALRMISVSGECMSKETGLLLAEHFPDIDIYHVYGLTEAGPRVSFLPPSLFRQHPDSVGYPLASVRCKVVGRDGNEAQPNEEGMLWICGANITEGYYKNPEQTQKALRNGWLCTGDIARIDEKGLLYIRGRADEMILRAGMNIYPQEIENLLKQDDRVEDVLAYGYTNAILGSQIGLKIAGDFSDIHEVKKLCGALLPAFQMPSKIEIVEHIAKNGSGKMIRKKDND